MWLELIRVRSEATKKNNFYLDSHFLSFIEPSGKMTNDRWDKRINVFKRDDVFILVNITNIHWTFMHLNIQKKEVKYYDSMIDPNNNGDKYLNTVKQWLIISAEKEAIDISQWKFTKGECPLQTNDYDCGIFALTAIDILTDKLPLNYNQHTLQHVRKRCIIDIIAGKLHY